MKNVLITGGSRGIGKACVERFAKEGYRTAFIYRTSHKDANDLAKATGALPFCADLSSADEAKRVCMQILDMLGSVDILINNCGIAQQKLFQDITDEDWRQMLDTNLSSAFFVTRAIVPQMIANHRGRILNVGSVWGRCGASCEVHYSAAKAGLRGFTMALSKELAPSHITVNAVEPGVIETDMNRHLSSDTLKELADETPVGRLGKPEEVASLLLYLASEEASFITGQIIGIDGGFAR